MTPEKISVIIPCLNEVSTIGKVLKALLDQSYPNGEMEIILADGGSTDGTKEEIAQFHAANKSLQIRLVDNPKMIIPAALNTAIRASEGKIILRLDAHAIPEDDFLKFSVEDLVSGKGDNVGGLWLIEPGGKTWIARAIAESASNPLAVGDARYRYSKTEGLVDTVPFGCYFRDLVNRIGYYDESLLTNEDYEFNTRIRKAGGKIWFDPKIKSHYFARSSFKELAKQYWRYGYWKYQMLKRYPETIRLRQALPPLFIISLFILAITAVGIPFARLLLALEIVVYLLALFSSALVTALKKKDLSYIIGIPMAIASMHFAWGMGFLGSIFSRSPKSASS